MAGEIQVVDGLIDRSLQEHISALVRSPIWQYGWKSTLEGERFAYWHSHFAGSEAHGASCERELASEPLLQPVHLLWTSLARELLAGHVLLRAYANAHTYGVEGSVHVDDPGVEGCISAVYYAHQKWHPNWAGETVFFADGGEGILRAVHPKPARVLVFPGAIAHCARAPSRECPELRISIVFKTRPGGSDAASAQISS